MTLGGIRDNGALALLGQLVLPDGRRWGEVATDDQWQDAAAILDLDGTQTRHLLVRSRGRSKTTDVAGIAVAALLRQLTPDYPAYAVAGDRGQALRLRHAIQGFVRRTPALQDEIQVQSERAIAVRSDAELEVLAADGPGTWGVLGGFYVADELFNWPTTTNAQLVWDAIFSSLPKVPGCRLVAMSSAGDPAHWTKAIYDEAIDDPRWRVSHLRGPAPWQDPADLEEQRRRLRPSLFARLFDNEWTAAEDRLTTQADIAECATLDGPQPPRWGYRYVAGLDVGLKNDRTVACVVHAEPVVDRDPWGGQEQLGWRVVLDRMEVWQGSRQAPVQLNQVAQWLQQTALTYGCRVVFDPYQAVQLAQQLRHRGVVMEEFTFSSASVGQLASTMYSLLREHRIALPYGDTELLEELANVRLRETSPGVIRMDHDSGKHDDRAIALAMASHIALAGTRREQKSLTSPTPARRERWSTAKAR